MPQEDPSFYVQTSLSSSIAWRVHKDKYLRNMEHVVVEGTSTAPSESQKIAIVDGMVPVQHIAKKFWTISSVKDLGENFNVRLLVLTADFDEVILVFDKYKGDSLKQKTSMARQQANMPFSTGTNIKHVNMGCFLSDEKLKADLKNTLHK